jgi:hypothetical protein
MVTISQVNTGAVRVRQRRSNSIVLCNSNKNQEAPMMKQRMTTTRQTVIPTTGHTSTAFILMLLTVLLATPQWTMITHGFVTRVIPVVPPPTIMAKDHMHSHQYYSPRARGLFSLHASSKSSTSNHSSDGQQQQQQTITATRTSTPAQLHLQQQLDILEQYYLMDKAVRIPIFPSTVEENVNNGSYEEWQIHQNDSKHYYVAEIHIKGRLHLGVVRAIRWNTKQQQKGDDDDGDGTSLGSIHTIRTLGEPRVVVELILSDEEDSASTNDEPPPSYTTVDVGQITNLWTCTSIASDASSSSSDSGISRRDSDSAYLDLRQLQNDASKNNIVLPVGHAEAALARLYDSFRGRGRSSGKGSTLTKKHIANLSGGDEKIAQLLRRAMIDPRVVMSTDAASKLFDNGRQAATIASITGRGDDNNNQKVEVVASASTRRELQRIAGAFALDHESRLGGMFKRIPSLYLGAAVVDDHDHGEKDTDKRGGVGASGEVWLLNGGWQAVDQAVKAGAEGRKFVERASATVAVSEPKAQAASSSSTTAAVTPLPMVTTAADEQVLRRLECLAMGDARTTTTSDDHEDRRLEVGVRAALQSLQLPMTPDGAQQALVKLGQWSTNANGDGSASSRSRQGGHGKVQLEPWSNKVMQASSEYCDFLEQQRASASLVGKRSTSNDNQMTVTDLTKIPCLCIDAPNTSFRDDALGIRQRASTGRPVTPEGGKWEILVHITDVSDLYCPVPDLSPLSLDLDKGALATLREAAAMRGLSRYDLPGGPLHLLPPVVLRALSFQKKSTTTTTTTGGANRCVTFWAYLNQDGSGQMLDCGVERTLVSNPIMLTYAQATKILDEDTNPSTSTNKNDKVALAMLRILDKSLSTWSQQRLGSNEVARKRAARLQTKQLVAQQVNMNSAGTGRGGRGTNSFGGFERSRGHEMVDQALDLYANGVSLLLKQKKAPIPSASGASYSKRGARVGTAPLRRYMDGMIQRQILAVLVGHGYGGKPLTYNECSQINARVAKATNALDNSRRSTKGKGSSTTTKYDSTKNANAASSRPLSQSSESLSQQQRALQQLERQLSSRKGSGSQFSSSIVPAMATGNASNEVLIEGVGVLAKCRGIEGTLAPGKRLLVEITKLDYRTNSIRVRRARQEYDEQ